MTAHRGSAELDLQRLRYSKRKRQNKTLSAGNFTPPVDICEDAHQLVLRLEVPGIPQEDLQINLENQVLTVKGERKLAQDAKEENFHRIERRYGSFIRSFSLPKTIERDSTQANYEHDVLSLTLQKREKQPSRCRSKSTSVPVAATNQPRSKWKPRGQPDLAVSGRTHT